MSKNTGKTENKEDVKTVTGPVYEVINPQTGEPIGDVTLPAEPAQMEDVVPQAEPAQAAPTKVREQYAYVGPSRRETKLTESRILIGTKQEVLGYFADEIKRWPEVKHLIVPVSELASARAQIRAGGNLLSQHYAALQAAKKGA